LKECVVAWKEILILFLTWVVSLVMWPGQVSLLPQEPAVIAGILVLWSSFDMLGRFTVRIKVISSNLVLTMCICRVVLVPPFLLCVKPLVLRSVAYPIVLTIFAAFTTGYASSAGMILGAQKVDDSLKDSVSTALALGLFSGAAVGSGISYAVTILQHP